MNNKEYLVSCELSWVESIQANSEEDAIKKMIKKTKFGNGNIPKEYAVFSLACPHD